MICDSDETVELLVPCRENWGGPDPPELSVRDPGEAAHILNDCRVMMLLVEGEVPSDHRRIQVLPRRGRNFLADDASKQEVCAVGAPDDRWGENVLAFVVPSDDAIRWACPTLPDATTAKLPQDAVARSLRECCMPKLATFEVPKMILPVCELPRGTTGKLLKREVRDAPLSVRRAPGRPHIRLERASCAKP